MTTTVPLAGLRVMGDGALAETVRAALAGPHEAAVAVDVLIAEDEQEIGPAADSAREAGRGLMPVCLTPRGVRIGPLVAAGQPGCHLCHRVRQLRARSAGVPETQALWKGIAEGEVAASRPVLGPPVRAAVAALIADEVRRLAGGGPGRLAGAAIEVASATMTLTRHRFIAEPGCAWCGELPDDTEQAGAFTLVSRPKRAPGDFRQRHLAGEHERLVELMVDAQTGVLSTVNVHHNHPMILAAAFGGEIQHAELSGYGRTFTYPASVSVAIAEALERLGGGHPRARRTAVRASFRELGPRRAVEPTLFGLPAQPPDHYSQAYHPDLPVEWVYGYSFARRAPILVPQTFAYYGAPGTVFGSESSNGCALGATVEEAILHGIFEVAERDAFLSTWYARLPVPRIDPATSADATTRALVAWLERSSGSRLHAFDITMPEGLPAVWLMLVDDEVRPGHPRAFCGAGAHLDPERALWSALVELASVAEATRDLVAADTTGAGLVADADLVHTMEDHMFAAAHPDSWERFSFLYQRPGVLSMAQAYPHEARYQPSWDLLDDLQHAAGRYLESGHDVIVVDQTATEQATVGLTSVKVLIPGLLPMVFGHRNRRVDLPRLRDLPVRLGYRAQPLSPEEINPHPHPFP